MGRMLHGKSENGHFLEGFKHVGTVLICVVDHPSSSSIVLRSEESNGVASYSEHWRRIGLGCIDEAFLFPFVSMGIGICIFFSRHQQAHREALWITFRL
jgi:hypothetical protein